jgi:hypothetical protein
MTRPAASEAHEPEFEDQVDDIVEFVDSPAGDVNATTISTTERQPVFTDSVDRVKVCEEPVFVDQVDRVLEFIESCEPATAPPQPSQSGVGQQVPLHGN